MKGVLRVVRGPDLRFGSVGERYFVVEVSGCDRLKIREQEIFKLDP